jgi:hypothetical protein
VTESDRNIGAGSKKRDFQISIKSKIDQMNFSFQFGECSEKNSEERGNSDAANRNTTKQGQWPLTVGLVTKNAHGQHQSRRCERNTVAWFLIGFQDDAVRTSPTAFKRFF